MLILHIRKHFRVRATEWMLSGVMLLWGLLLLRPGMTFSAPAYAELARLAPEETWGLACLGIGGLRLMVLVINGAMRPSPHLRAFLALVSALFWYQLSVGFLLADGNGTAIAVYPLAVGFDVFNAAMAAGDAGEVDRAARARSQGGGGPQDGGRR